MTPASNIVPLPQARGLSMSVGGVMSATPLAVLQKQEKAAAEAANNQPVIKGLAGHIRAAWQINKEAKQAIEERILKAIRQRRGEYDPDKAALIKQEGGADIYVLLTAAKCRAVSSWLRDLMLSQGSEKPWTVRSTPIPTVPPDIEQAMQARLAQEVQALAMSGVPLGDADVQELIRISKDEALARLQDEARARATRAETYMEDQLAEGGFLKAVSQFIDDFTTFPAAILKGPVVRRRKRLTWGPGADGTWAPTVTEELMPEWERVDPVRVYPAPFADSPDDGDFIEFHSLSRADLRALIGVEGYSESAIKAVLEEHGRGGLKEWTHIESARLDAEGRSQSTSNNPGKLIDALQFWGSVPGQLLIDWGMDETQVEDPTEEYEIEAWLVGQWVIKAVLNPDLRGRRPYYKTSYEELPGLFWGNAPTDLVRDDQDMCNAAARALANNMGIASGPQVWINIERLPAGEDITNLYPWKIHQFVGDQMGGSQAPMGFFQPNSNATELYSIIQRFSDLADEHTGVPKYMSGESPDGSVGRTASGMSMLFSHAGKVMKQAIANIDLNVIGPLIERLYDFNMMYSDDETIKGDLRVIARGLSSVTVQETAQVRRNEFLQQTANPFDLQILGIEGRAELLRESAKGLNVNVDKIIPNPEKLRVQKRLSAMQTPGRPMAGAPGQPAPAPVGSGQALMDGAPTTDAFQPAPQSA